MRVSDIHVTSVTMLLQQQTILTGTKNLNIRVSDTHVASVIILQEIL